MTPILNEIDFSRYRPSDVHYDDKGLWVGNQFFRSQNPRLDFAKVLSHFKTELVYGYIGGSMIAENTVYQAGRVDIGFNCVIGGVGFGYERDDKRELFQIPHLGNVILKDGVAIHNNVCIDRAVIGSTIIGEGTKIDNLVHIAHGVIIGKNCLIVAGTVIGGSCEIGDNCFIGINASIKNKVKIGNGVTIGMAAVITKDVPDGVTVIGVNKIL